MKKLYFAILTLCAVIRTQGQGTFQNLGFESAHDAGYSPGGIPTADAIPGWRAYLGANEMTTIVYDTISIGGAAVSLQSTNGFYPPIVGKYSVVLQSSVGVEPTTAAVAQTGQIPGNALSLQFYGANFMQVAFAGQLLSLVQLGSGPSYHIMGADISAYAGQTGELKFLVPRTGPIGVMTSSYLDNIVFSSQQIPEPGCISLVMLGAVGLKARQLLGCRKQTA